MWPLYVSRDWVVTVHVVLWSHRYLNGADGISCGVAVHQPARRNDGLVEATAVELRGEGGECEVCERV